jgi:hypothetical protein
MSARESPTRLLVCAANLTVVFSSTTADDRPIVLKSRWQFNSKGGAVLLMYRLRLFRVPKGFFDEFDLPILKRKVVVTQVYECPGFYMHLSNQGGLRPIFHMVYSSMMD